MRRRRSLGRPVKVETEPRTGITTVYFDSGAARMYSRDEIAEHVVEVARQALADPDLVDEHWYEFLRELVGAEVMTATMAAVAVLEA